MGIKLLMFLLLSESLNRKKIKRERSIPEPSIKKVSSCLTANKFDLFQIRRRITRRIFMNIMADIIINAVTKTLILTTDIARHHLSAG